MTGPRITRDDELKAPKEWREHECLGKCGRKRFLRPKGTDYRMCLECRQRARYVRDDAEDHVIPAFGMAGTGGAK